MRIFIDMDNKCKSCSNCLHNHEDEEGCAIHQDMEPCDDWTEKAEQEQYGQLKGGDAIV